MNDDEIINIPMRYGDALSLNLILSKADVLISWYLNDQYEMWHTPVCNVQDSLYKTLAPIVRNERKDVKPLPEKVIAELFASIQEDEES